MQMDYNMEIEAKLFKLFQQVFKQIDINGWVYFVFES